MSLFLEGIVIEQHFPNWWPTKWIPQRSPHIKGVLWSNKHEKALFRWVSLLQHSQKQNYSHTNLSKEGGYSAISQAYIHSFIHSFMPIEGTQNLSELLLYRKKVSNDVIEALFSPIFFQMYQNNVIQTFIYSSLPLTFFLLSLFYCCHVSSFPPPFWEARTGEGWNLFHK